MPVTAKQAELCLPLLHKELLCFCKDTVLAFAEGCCACKTTAIIMCCTVRNLDGAQRLPGRLTFPRHRCLTPEELPSDARLINSNAGTGSV